MLSQVMRPSNGMFNLHDNVTEQFQSFRSDPVYRFYYQNTQYVGLRNLRGNYPRYAVCEWTDETEALVNSKTVSHSPPSFDTANFVCYYNLVVNDQLACKQR